MPIQWYPGHMTEAKRVMVETIPAHDVVIEVLDARLPHSSSNPIVSEIRTDKPRIKVLTKSDLAPASRVLRARFEVDDVGTLELELLGVLDHDDPLALRHIGRERVEE